MNAVDLLASQHRQIERLLSRLETTTMKRHKEMLLAALAEDLSTHALIGEHQFYPAVRSALRSEDAVLKSLEDHLLTIKRLIVEVVTSAADDANLSGRLDSLKECVDHHVQMEETELFPRVKTLIDPAEMRILGASLEVEQSRLEGRRRPCGPASPERPTGRWRRSLVRS
jgi:hemerythrin superfamily protein